MKNHRGSLLSRQPDSNDVIVKSYCDVRRRSETTAIGSVLQAGGARIMLGVDATSSLGMGCVRGCPTSYSIRQMFGRSTDPPQRERKDVFCENDAIWSMFNCLQKVYILTGGIHPCTPGYAFPPDTVGTS